MPSQSIFRQLPFGLSDGIPDWHHPQSYRIHLEKADSSHVVIQAPAARFTIVELLDADTIYKWIARWEILFSEGTGTRSEIVMSAQDLCEAFALNEHTECEGRWWANPHQDIASRKGVYFRYDRYLNIPGPGTGQDGDPNISIFLTAEIKKAVTHLVLEAEEQNTRQISFDF